MLNPAHMPFKDNLASNALPRLSGMAVLEALGRDAGAFLQAQTMNDVRVLAEGQWQWNGWLTAKGRVVCLFALARVEAERWWLLLPDGGAAELRDALQRFVFRSKLALAVREDLALHGQWPRVGAAALAAGGPGRDRLLEADAGARGLDVGGDAAARVWWCLPRDHPWSGAPDPDAEAAWLGDDIAQGWPRLGRDQRELWTPQMLSLERLGAFSLKKGCYPGQEIVARTHYLGQAKRGLFRVEGDELREGASVRAGERSLGSLVCTDTGRRQGLAVLALDGADAGDLNIDGRPCRRLPLSGGMQRPA